ncbi:MAG TPA: hypothetical protein EYQ50_15245 [Verrucomicrobiales bacterium]|nr:hypothetical protein [Verrucomicrobiales bacterium]
MRLQEFIHILEVGGGRGFVKYAAFYLGLLVLTIFYNTREFENFTLPDSMDSAQLARNIASGEGFVTRFVRPISLHMVQNHREDGDLLLDSGHPDLANPPVYPLILAALMKVLPVEFEIDLKLAFTKYNPEVWIAVLNQCLFFGSALMLFFLARRLFDSGVAWVSVLIFLGTDLLWKFSISGLSTHFLIFLFLGIISLLSKMESSLETAETDESDPIPPRSIGWFAGMSLLLGVLLGIGGLTRYSFGFLVVPVVFYLGLFFKERRGVALGLTLLSFALVMVPWLMRNHQISGNFFGTAGYALYQDTDHFPENQLERTFDREEFEYGVGRVGFSQWLKKLLENGKEIFENHLLNLGGNWISAFFFTGLLIPFSRSSLSRLRLFILISIPVLFVAQALGVTYLSDFDPQVHSENLLVILSPLVFMFGTGMVFILIDHLDLPVPELRRFLITGLVLLFSAPLILTLLPPKKYPVMYPPYHPPVIQHVARWMHQDETMMSDMPWAVAWYGNRQTIWATADSEKEFFEINDEYKTITALYLTSLTLDGKLFSDIVKGRDQAWGGFLMKILGGVINKKEGRLPAGFPLSFSPPDFFPLYLRAQLFLTDRPRWGDDEYLEDL